jgi:hypothetical protein
MGAHRSETSKLQHLLDSRLRDGGEVISLKQLTKFYPPGRFLVLISVKGWVDSKAIVRLEGLGQLKHVWAAHEK